MLKRTSEVLEEAKSIVTSYEALIADDAKRVSGLLGHAAQSGYCAICARGEPIDEVMKLQEIEVTSEQGTEEWLEARRKCITASDMATVLCQNPYSSRPELLRQKVFKIPFKGSTEAVEHGHAYEPVAIRRYEQQTGHKVLSFGLLHQPGSILGASPDGVTLCGRAVEVKCPLTRKVKCQDVPKHYMAQVQCQLEVMGLKECDFVQLDTKTDTFDVCAVPRDMEWMPTYWPKIEHFWKLLQECYADPSQVPQKKKKKTNNEDQPKASEVNWIMEDL